MHSSATASPHRWTTSPGAANVGIGTLYRHFPTRDDLIGTLVAADLERVAALADELAAEDSDDVLERWLGELVAHTVTFRGLAEAVVTATGGATAFGAACQRVHSAGTRLVRREQQRGTMRNDVDADDAIDLANAIAWATQHDDDDRRRRRLVRVCVDGLGGAHRDDALTSSATIEPKGPRSPAMCRGTLPHRRRSRAPLDAMTGRDARMLVTRRGAPVWAPVVATG